MSFESRHLPPTSVRPTKLRRAEQLAMRQYCDFVGMILWWGMVGEKVSVLLTDYTQHPEIKAVDGNENRPSGKFTVPVTLWDDHVVTFQSKQPRPGDFILLRNCVPRKNNGNHHMELHMHGPRPNAYVPQPPMVLLGETDPLVASLLKRRDAWLQEREQAMEAEALEASSSIENRPHTRLELSLATRTMHGDMPLRHIKDIQGHLFKRFRMKFRILHHHPAEIKDFTKAKCTKCSTEYDTAEKLPKCPCCEVDTERTFVYRFSFHVQDDLGREIVVDVMDKDAQILFNNRPAANFYDNTEAYLEVRKQLKIMGIHAASFTVPGTHKPQPPFFECCIQTYVDPPKEESREGTAGEREVKSESSHDSDDPFESYLNDKSTEELIKVMRYSLFDTIVNYEDQ